MEKKTENEIDVTELMKKMNSGGFGNEKKNDSHRNFDGGRTPYQKSRNSGGTAHFRKQDEAGYVGAPYNFVSFSKDVYEYPQGKLTPHNQMTDNLYSGEIDYRITAETPVIVDDGSGHFRKDSAGRYAIPGSSIRGLIRSNVQILGLSSIYDDIDDYALMYRNVAFGAQKQRYNDVLGSKIMNVKTGTGTKQVNILTNVKAGYLSRESGKYLIYRTRTEEIKKELGAMNYYVLSERRIVEDYLKRGDGGKGFSYPVFLKNGKSILQHEFRKFTREEVKGRIHYKGLANEKYSPYMIPVSYIVKNLKDVEAVDVPGKYPLKGYAVSSGAMREKKAVYIVPEIDRDKESILIPESDITAFKIDYEKRKNNIRQQNLNHFFDLPEEGEIKPVFYIQLGGRIYFGFTPRLRLFYDKTIKAGLKGKQSENVLDYGKALFGYCGNDGNYRSRLSFSDAVLTGAGRELPGRRAILAEPKPTSCLDYLKQTDPREMATYNGSFELRGMKQYWLRDAVVEDETANDQKRKSVASSFCPLEAGSEFAGKVRFQNLTKDELGLLLWSIRLNKNSRMNIGKAKAFGYGNISVEIVDAKCIDLKKAYCSVDGLDLSPFVPLNVDEMIACYKSYINTFLGNRKIDDLPSVREFFLMKNTECMPPKESIRYMDIDKREYQSRKEKLPSVESIVKGKMR